MADPPLVVDIDDSEGPRGERLGSVALRRPACGRRSCVRLARPARRVGLAGAAVHVGHDRRPERRDVSPSRRVSQRARQRARLQARAGQRVPVDAADVPLLRLDVHVGGDGRGRDARLPAPRRSGADLPGHPRRARHASVRRADRAQPARARAGVGEGAVRPLRSTSPPAAPRRLRRSSRRWKRWAFA